MTMKKSLWQRYSEGHTLRPTFDKQLPKSYVLMPPLPQKPRIIKEGKTNLNIIEISVLMVLWWLGVTLIINHFFA